MSLKFLVIILSLTVTKSRQNLTSVYNSIILFKYITSNYFPNSIRNVKHRGLIGEKFNTRET